ncbi:MAG TPA: PorV/PorQ family protein [Gemmatimonadaceae bacterium]|nr:PorV/PorQ family protein [Gemmatimonadaceae bacterium]
MTHTFSPRAVLAFAALVAATPASAQITGILPTPDNPPTRQGTRGGTFLHLDIGARSNAMAGAIGSSVRGPTAWFVNPAGTADTEGFSVAAGRQNLYGDLDVAQTYAGLSMPLLGGVVGVSLNTLNSGDIPRTTEAFPLGDPVAGLNFDWNSTAAGLGYARRLTDRLSIGGGLKYITEGITGASTSWIAFDIGTQFNTGVYGLVIGGALQHLGGGANVSGTAIQRVINNANVDGQQIDANLLTIRSDLPTTFRFSLGNELIGTSEALLGGAGGPHGLHAEAAVSDAVDAAAQLGIGVEYSFRSTFFARAGKRFYGDDRSTGSSTKYGLSGGFGLRFPFVGRSARFDYSFTSLGDLKDIQVFSFEVSR